MDGAERVVMWGNFGTGPESGQDDWTFLLYSVYPIVSLVRSGIRQQSFSIISPEIPTKLESDNSDNVGTAVATWGSMADHTAVGKAMPDR